MASYPKQCKKCHGRNIVVCQNHHVRLEDKCPTFNYALHGYGAYRCRNYECAYFEKGGTDPCELVTLNRPNIINVVTLD